MNGHVLVASLLIIGSGPAAWDPDTDRTHVQHDEGQASACDTGGSALVGAVLIETGCGMGGPAAGGATQVSSDPDVLDVQYVPACSDYSLDSPLGIACNEKLSQCGEGESKFDTQVLYAEGAEAHPSGGWAAVAPTCIGEGEALPPGRSVGPIDVLQALHRTGLPKAELQTQPGFDSGKTLVNLDTNFYTVVDPVTDTFTLLGQHVDVEATPSTYTWRFDDPTLGVDDVQTTSTPGAKYPNLDVTYAYTDAHVTVHPSVDVTYSARFTVNGGPWQTIPATITIEGDPIDRYIAEATPMLS